MAIRERLYTIDDIWRLEQQPLRAAERYYLIDGELITKMSPSQHHALIASELARLLGNYVVARGLGRVLVECGYHPPHDRRTVLLPDVSFESSARAAQPPLTSYAPYMPDLAVEILSPTQTLAQLQRKAQVYLAHGTEIVWLVLPGRASVEVWRRADDGAPVSERIGRDGSLSGGDVLPGFTLELRRLFPD